jgi:hypothetical protein
MALLPEGVFGAKNPFNGDINPSLPTKSIHKIYLKRYEILDFSCYLRDSISKSFGYKRLISALAKELTWQ